MIPEIFYSFIKYGGISAILMAFYLVYIYIIGPYLTIRKYRKYANVLVNKKFVPLIGEGVLFREDIQNNKPPYYHQIEKADKVKGIDMKLAIIGNKTFLYLISNRAYQEFQNLSPKYIDRFNFSRNPMGKIFADWFVHDRSNDKWK